MKSSHIVQTSRIAIAIMVLSLGFSLLSTNADAFSVRTTFETLGKGYQDVDGEDHFRVAQGLRINAYQLGNDALSFHGYMQYSGDNQDDFSNSAFTRLYHGYLKYSKKDCPLTLRGGRFFLFRGVGIGVLDGGEATWKLSRRAALTVYGGQQGPLNREWEVDRQGDSPMYGGEFKWRPGNILGYYPAFSFSYTNQTRNDNVIRHLAGISMYLRLNRHWSTLEVLHLNMSGNVLRKALTRWKYTSQKFQLSLEAALINNYSAEYSYFSDFETEGGVKRVRNTLEYHFVPRKWGAGLSTMYFGTSKAGFRTGPYLIFPFGRIGYHFSSGDQPKNNVFWGYIRYNAFSWLDLYGYAAASEYEWEAMDIPTQDMTTMNAGLTVRPPFLKRTEWGLEVQNYSTPIMETDRRVIARFRWNIDFQGAK